MKLIKNYAATKMNFIHNVNVHIAFIQFYVVEVKLDGQCDCDKYEQLKKIGRSSHLVGVTIAFYDTTITYPKVGCNCVSLTVV